MNSIGIRSKVRTSNIELYRIVVMLAIVAHHYAYHSGLLDNQVNANPFTVRSVFISVIGMWGKTGINCFVLITGYYMCKSKITLRKFVKMICQVELYNILISILFLYNGYHYHFTEFVKDIMPIKDVSDKFVSCFLLFWLTIPFLNASISHLGRQNHKFTCILLLIIYVVLPYVPGFRVWWNYLIWFTVLYLVSSYIRFYGFPYDKNYKLWCFATLVSVSISVMSVVFINYLQAENITSLWRYWLVSDSNAPFAFLVGISSFMMFKNMKLRYNKYLNLIGGSTFGIYLIHDNNDAMRQWLWNDMLHVSDSFYSAEMYLYALLSPICVFTVCSLLEVIRIKFVEAPMLILYDRYVKIGVKQ